jgi:hypothetical protein
VGNKGGGPMARGNKLTLKQEMFVQSLLAGNTKRKAYEDAGYSMNMDEIKTDIAAQKVFNNPKVQLRYNNLINEHKEKAMWGRERAYKELLELISDSKKDGNYNGRLGAIKELNSLDDLYPKEKKEVDLKVSSSDVFSKLKGALKDG